MKRFLKQRIDNYITYLSKDLPILQKNSMPLQVLNFDFQDNSQEYLDNFETINQDSDVSQDESELLRKNYQSTESLTQDQNRLIGAIKLDDNDIEPLLIALSKNKTYKGALIINEHNLTDQTCILISSFLAKENPQIEELSLSDCCNFSYLTGFHIGNALKVNKTLKKIRLHNCTLQTDGANRLIESIKFNKQIDEYDFGNLTDSSFNYLTSYLSKHHIVKNISFGEDPKEPWKEETKAKFINCLREFQFNSQILSLKIYCSDLEKHKNFVGEIAILCKKNKKIYDEIDQNEKFLKDLNTSHPEYYNADKHQENAFKFSVKTYVSNVVETNVDEGLYDLEKERTNMIRDEHIYEINKKPINKKILEDLFTADGSLLVLARYLVGKLDKKN